MSSSLHPDGRLNPSDSVTNDSDNPSIHDIVQSRRHFLKGSLSATAVALSGCSLFGGSYDEGGSNEQGKPQQDKAKVEIGFTSVAANVKPMTDAVTVPVGYTARILLAWGDPIKTAKQTWDSAKPMDEATQLHAYGAHTDGMHYFPNGRYGNKGGLLVSNSEYVDPALVNGITPSSAYATAPLTLAMVRAQQAAHGVNVVALKAEKIRQVGGEYIDAEIHWQVEHGSRFNRRITGNTPCSISGPAAGSDMLKTAADPKGNSVLGTLNNCANGYTPWGTYLTCEENFNGYFGTSDTGFEQSNHEKRYGVTNSGFGYRWHEVDDRFNLSANRNEPNRFGWVVEVDPWNKTSRPVKRTALGRFKHESASMAMDADNRVALYMGDDERNEYVYKFVCQNAYNGSRKQDMLDHGTLYVAKFNADGTGEWVALVHGQHGLTAANGFANQAEIVTKARQAADRVGATTMDRPEWTAVHPETGEVFLTLTNNKRRGNTPTSSPQPDGTVAAGKSNPAVNAANPRSDNDFGHIIRWRETDNKVSATSFNWDIFVQAGDRNTTKKLGASYKPAEFGGQSVGYLGNIKGDDFGAPDGLWIDPDGRLWIQTDQSGNAEGDWVNIGSNSMMCANPDTGEIRRFLTAPPHAEVTGITATPDGKTMFVGIQHPGEDWESGFTDNSTWPDSGVNGDTKMKANKPRSGVVVITKDDGGVIGT